MTIHDMRTGKPVNTAGGGGDGIEPRVAKLEAGVEHIHSDINQIKTDLRHLLWMNIGSFLILAGMIITSALGLAYLIAKGFHWI